MKEQVKFLILSILLTSTLGVYAQQNLDGRTPKRISQFKDGERVVFLGNSITDGGHYHSYIWLYYMTRFPNMNLHIENAGIGGDRAIDMHKRLDSDVFSKNPTTLVVTFGMNDSGYLEYNGEDGAKFGEDKYKETYENYKLLESKLKGANNMKIVMMGGSPYDETTIIEGNTSLKGKNSVMQRIVDFQKKSAEENNWDFFDLNKPMTEINLKFQDEDSTFTLCGSDRIHPENDGHMVMAYMFLKEQGMDSNVVSEFEVNSKNKSVIKSTNCEISNIKGNKETISFDYQSYSLPYPLDTIPRGWNAKKSQADAMKYVPFIDEMNREIIKVSGLQDGNYTLLIDGLEIGEWSSKDLSVGVNLAVETKTPQYQQSLSIMHLNELRWEIERRFRDYAWVQFNFFQSRGLLFADNREALEALSKAKVNDGWLEMHWNNYTQMMHSSYREILKDEMKMIISKIYDINEPVMRKITIVKN